MFTLKWNDSYWGRPYQCTFWDGWKRLNRCNAAICVVVGDKENNALGYTIQDSYIGLVSYATPIAFVRAIHCLDDNETIGLNIYVNEESWNCSRTTIQHLSKFLKLVSENENVAISYQHVKEAMYSTRMHFFFKEYVDSITCVYRCTDAEMTDKFNAYFPYYC